MALELKKDGNTSYIQEGSGDQVMILLHGLVGMLSNFDTVVQYLSKRMTVFVPLLPLYSLDLRYTSVSSLQRFVHRFMRKHCRGESVHFVGNSLGGHIALLQAIGHPEMVSSLTLTGSSGLFESGLGDSYPRRGDYEYVKRQAEMVFYNPKVATKEIVDNAYQIVNNRMRAMKTLYLARSALKHNLSNELHKVACPTLILWGENDLVTPKFVAEDFHRLIRNSELIFIEKCGHAAMMEHPNLFNEHLCRFLENHKWI